MIATIDIGNTKVSLGIFKNGEMTGFLKLPTLSSREKFGSAIASFSKKNKLTGTYSAVVVGSVVPRLDNAFKTLSRKVFGVKPIFINWRNAGIKILYRRPHELGTDRLADAIAGYGLFGGPAIIVDFGTAITFNCIGSRGEFLGGAIIPGPEISSKSLHSFTAKLPSVKFGKPSHTIGHSTEECITSGLYNGYIGAIENILEKFKNELGSGTPVVSTGGSAGFFTPKIGIIDKIVPDLTLYGLYFFWKNYKQR